MLKKGDHVMLLVNRSACVGRRESTPCAIRITLPLRKGRPAPQRDRALAAINLQRLLAVARQDLKRTPLEFVKHYKR